MMLQEKGLLNVQDPICMYVPDCAGREQSTWESITIHHLLTHTSGIPSFTSFPEYMDHARVPQTIEETIALFKDKPLRFAPGAAFEYSNSGYILLGYVIEAVTGQSYEDFLKQNIFDPLGMVDSGYDSTRSILTDRAAGYARENGILLNAIHIEMDAPHAAGALYSTVEDLFLWDQSLYTTVLVSQETLDTLFTAHTTAGSPDVAYGYGWFLEEVFDRTYIGHTGGINGFAAYIGRFPQEGICIVLLSNFEFVPIYDFGHDLAAIVQDIFDPMLVAHWKFDETDGITAHDSVGSYDATVMGGATWQGQGAAS